MEFQLPDPGKQARINGELHLQWTTAPGARVAVGPSAVATHAVPAASAVPGTPSVPEEVEKRLENLEKQLPPNAFQAMKAGLARTRSFDQLTPRKLQTALPKPAIRLSARAVADPLKTQRDLERAKAICAAFGRNVPGRPNVCATVPQ